MSDLMLKERLEEIKRKNLYRSLKFIDSPQNQTVIIEGNEYIVFCSNNYLGLATHPRLIEKAKEAAERWGVGAVASRLVTGSMTPHLLLERELGEFCGYPSSLFFITGYMANIALLSSIPSSNDLILSDELNHASLIDGIRLSKAEKIIYKHCDIYDLESKLKRYKNFKGELFIVTESIFSMDGDMAPLEELSEIAKKYNAYLIVDEAHSLGVLGEGGRGVCYSLRQKPFAVIGTMGKAFGVNGAFICGSKLLIEYLINVARPFIYTTAPNPVQVEVCREALRVVSTEEGEELRRRLESNVKRLREILKKYNAPILERSAYHIIPQLIGEVEKTLAVGQALFEHGILVTPIRPPTVPKNSSRLRWTATALHSEREFELLEQALLDVTEKISFS